MKLPRDDGETNKEPGRPGPARANRYNSGMSDATIDRDVLCRGCGYNLRGLSPAGRCPECAMAVSISLLPSSLSLNGPRHFRLADAGTWMILAACFWEIISKAGWLLTAFHGVSGEWLRPIELVCRNPSSMVLICLLQNAALFAFGALARSQFRVVLFVLGLILCAMEVPFCIGNRWDTEINVLAEAFVAMVFYTMWLGHAASFAASAGDGSLAKRFDMLRWIVPAALTIHFLGFVVFRSPFDLLVRVSDGAIIVLSAWMIFLIVRLRVALQRIAPFHDMGGANAAVGEVQSPDLARHGRRWISRVLVGLVGESIFLSLTLVFPVLSFVNSRLGISTLPMAPIRQDLPAHLFGGIRVIVFAVVGAAQVVCLWWISTPPPDEASREGAGSRMTPRQWLRLFAAFAFFTAMASPIGAIARIHSPEAVRWVLILLEGAMFFSLYLYIEQDLSVRAGDRDVRTQAAMLKWFLPLIVLAMPVVLFIASAELHIGRLTATALNHLQHMLGIVAGAGGFG